MEGTTYQVSLPLDLTYVSINGSTTFAATIQGSINITSCAGSALSGSELVEFEVDHSDQYRLIIDVNEPVDPNDSSATYRVISLSQ